MGATLRYAKVIDADRYQRQGAVTKPGTDSVLRLPSDGPATALPFLVLRAWDDIDSGGVGESWRIESPQGRTLYTVPSRTVLADQGEIVDEIDDLTVEYAGDGYTLVLLIDEREVARVDVPVRVDQTGERLAE